MAKRGYKLQELVAHSDNVNCVSIGKKAGRLFITGGDDHQVRVWSVGKPTSLMSLCGLTSPVESVAFDSAEVLVAAGALTGMIKLWDLEEAKIVRTLTGHKANCSAVEFHPFGEFFASGSLDTHLKIWDIRKKGCMHTYKGHSQGIGIIKFSPDGRWVVSGGLDNSVKIWDLTAGKLLHDFKSHDGPIRAIDFHPLEFLLATGSSDKTVKFWDLETFELIGASRPEATGVRAMTFHPDGRTLFCGLEDSFKVYSWEPIIRHDAIDMGWSTLGDLCIHDDKLLGCSFCCDSVGVWAADISLIEPYRDGIISEQNATAETKSTIESRTVGKQDNEPRFSLRSHTGSPDSGTREKTIYVVSCEHSEGLKKVDLSDKVVPSEAKDYEDAQSKKRSGALGVYQKSSGNSVNRSLLVPNIVPRDSSDKKKINGVAANLSTVQPSTCPENDASKVSTKDSATVKVVNGVSVVPGRTRSLVEKFERREVNSSIDLATHLPSDHIPEADNKIATPISQSQMEKKEPTKDLLFRKESSTLVSTAIDSAKLLKQEDSSPPHLPGTEAVQPISKKEMVQARMLDSDSIHRKESEPPKLELLAPQMSEMELSTSEVSENESLTPQVSESESLAPQVSERESLQSGRNSMQPQYSGRESPEPPIHRRQSPKLRGESPQTRISRRGSPQLQAHRGDSSQMSGREPSRPYRIRRESPIPLTSRRESSLLNISKGDATRESTVPQFSRRESSLPQKSRRESVSQISRRESSLPQISRRELFQPNRAANFMTQTLISDSVLVKSRPSRKDFPPLQQSEMDWRDAQVVGLTHLKASKSGMDDDHTLSDREWSKPQLSEKDPEALSDKNVAEVFLQDHDIFLSTLRSRLTKLQVVHHFWERNDIKGAINALKKLPDQSVQSDVVSVLAEKMEILSLDLFSCLLPVLVELLDSTTERHISVSLELLVKLVAVFGPIIFATASGPPCVGVDLHAEERREWCKLCFTQLQKVQQMLPPLIRRGGAVARSAQELNLVLRAA